MSRPFGYKHTKETRKKMSATRIGKRHPLSKETRKKISLSKIGKHHILTKECKKAISKKMKGKRNALGFKHTQEWKIKASERQKGEKANNWQGGISFEPYTIDWTETLKHSIRERDHFTCKICSQRGWHVHHIDYNKKNCNLYNLITLCSSCHSKTNFNRKSWTDYFICLKVFL